MTARKEAWGWMVDFVFQHPDGRKERIRRKSPVQTRRASEEFERKCREGLLNPTKQSKKTPTEKEFSEEFMKVYAKAHNKPSEIEAKERNLKLHIMPFFGTMRLDEIGMRDVDSFKSEQLKKGYSPKTVNNHVCLIRKMINLAVEWGIIDKAPRFKQLRTSETTIDFLNFNEAQNLIQACDDEWKCMVIVGLKTGLRINELIAL